MAILLFLLEDDALPALRDRSANCFRRSNGTHLRKPLKLRRLAAGGVGLCSTLATLGFPLAPRGTECVRVELGRKADCRIAREQISPRGVRGVFILFSSLLSSGPGFVPVFRGHFRGHFRSFTALSTFLECFVSP
jgi:hypothetical protein